MLSLNTILLFNIKYKYNRVYYELLVSLKFSTNVPVHNRQRTERTVLSPSKWNIGPRFDTEVMCTGRRGNAICLEMFSSKYL